MKTIVRATAVTLAVMLVSAGWPRVVDSHNVCEEDPVDPTPTCYTNAALCNVQGIFPLPEIVKRYRRDTLNARQAVYETYEIILGRGPDLNEIGHQIGRLNANQGSMGKLVVEIAVWAETELRNANRSVNNPPKNAYDIVRLYKANPNGDQAKIRAVESLYKVLLGRDADDGGLEAWIGQLRIKQIEFLVGEFVRAAQNGGEIPR